MAFSSVLKKKMLAIVIVMGLPCVGCAHQTAITQSTRLFHWSIQQTNIVKHVINNFKANR